MSVMCKKLSDYLNVLDSFSKRNAFESKTGDPFTHP